MKILRIAPVAVAFSLLAAGGAPKGIVYTCDPSVLAIAGFCDTLNTTISGLYSSAFANANASIYIQFANLAAGGFASTEVIYPTSYAAFRGSLQTTLAGPNDNLAFTSSVPPTNPINPNYPVLLTGPLVRALGLAPPSGLNSDQQVCTLGTTGCYDGVITLGNSFQASGLWFYRTGIISANQFDIYTAVQFETNKILGFLSCLNACTTTGGLTYITPLDLFRYQSNGTRSFASGDNGPCANGNGNNACFSLDGVHYLEQFNNLPGATYGAWATNCNKTLVQNASICVGIPGTDIALNAEGAALDVIGYTLAANAPASNAYFSDLVFGGGFQSTLTYINYSTSPVTCTTNFYSDTGTPLSIPFQQGSVSTRTDTLQPGQSIHDQTLANLAAASVEGWAQASCTGPVEASLLYRYYTNGVAASEAGVNAEAAPTSYFVTFAQTATGVAYANPSPNVSATVTFTVFSTAGVKLGSTSLTLAPLAHGSSNVGPLLGLTNFTGMLEITSSNPIISLSLNAEAFPVISSLPPGDLPAGFGGGGGQTNYYFSDLAFGGGFQSTLTLINYSPQSVTCVTNFYSDSGSPLSVPFAQGAISTRTDVLAAGASIHDQTSASLAATVAEGWAQSSCTGATQAGLLYRYYSNGAAVSEAGVNAETAPTTKFATFAQTATGVAYANPSTTQSATVTFTVYSATGTDLGSQTITLGPLQHSAANLGPLLGLTSFTGFVKITSTIPIISLSLNAEAFPVISSLPPGDLPTLTTLVP